VALGHLPDGRVGVDGVGRQRERVRREEVGAEVARLDDGDLDTEVGDLRRERLGQALQCELARAVERPARHGGQPEDRRDVDDVPALLPAQDRQRRPQNVPHTDHLHVEHVADIAGAGLLHRGQEAVAGVVDDDVEAVEPLGRLIDGLLDSDLVTQVDGQWKQARGVDAVADPRQQAIRGPGGGRDVVAAPEQLGHQLQTQTARGAGHEPRRWPVRRETHGDPPVRRSRKRRWVCRSTPFQSGAGEPAVGAHLRPCATADSAT
jgi:hypothetical protein